MKVLGSTEWRAFSSGCREVVHLRVHTGWKMERFILAYTGVVCLIVFRIFTSPREWLRSIVMSLSVCLSACLRGYLRNHTRDLYQIFVHVA